MEPEISRRCSVCGATIRQQAAFCPQCGQPLTAQRPRDGERDPRATQIIVDSMPTRLEAESAPTTALDKAQTEALKAAEPDQKEQSPANAERTVIPPRPKRDDNLRGRVDKIRRASNVVIDQAAYDPSLRFLLVAAGFFLLFLFLLLASKLIG